MTKIISQIMWEAEERLARNPMKKAEYWVSVYSHNIYIGIGWKQDGHVFTNYWKAWADKLKLDAEQREK